MVIYIDLKIRFSISRKFNQNLTGLKAIHYVRIRRRKEFCVFLLMFNF